MPGGLSCCLCDGTCFTSVPRPNACANLVRAPLPAQDMEEGVPSSGSSGSDCSSPRGPKGGGTLKTCAVCIEDYRCVVTACTQHSPNAL